MLIRRETLDDRPAVDTVISAAFSRPGSKEPPPETALVGALRRDVGWIEALSLVAMRDRLIVGHVGDHRFYSRFGFVTAPFATRHRSTTFSATQHTRRPPP